MNTLEELQLDLIEIKTYRDLQDDEFEYFCFDIEYLYNIPKELQGSEDTYYEMKIQSLEDTISDYYINNPKPIKRKSNPRLNKYERKKITQQNLRKIKDVCSYYVISERDGYLERNYLTNHSNRYNRTVYYKRLSNVKVRRNKDFKLKGNSYRKVFDYWWEVN